MSSLITYEQLVQRALIINKDDSCTNKVKELFASICNGQSPEEFPRTNLLHFDVINWEYFKNIVPSIESIEKLLESRNIVIVDLQDNDHGLCMLAALVRCSDGKTYRVSKSQGILIIAKWNLYKDDLFLLCSSIAGKARLPLWNNVFNTRETFSSCVYFNLNVI